jgi:hypothetical protein
MTYKDATVTSLKLGFHLETTCNKGRWIFDDDASEEHDTRAHAIIIGTDHKTGKIVAKSLSKHNI